MTGAAKAVRVTLLIAGVLLISLVGGVIALWLKGEVPVTPRAVALAPEQVYARVAPSVAMIYAADASRKIVGRGSGIFVGRDLLATNCHVIARGKIYRIGYRQQHWSGQLAAYDTDKDLCVLKVQGLDVTPPPIGDARDRRVGQRVYTIGAPEGFDQTFSEGLVSGLREAGGRRYIQTTAPISEGSSGGGLFDSEGRLIGITSFVFSAGQNLNFAAPAEWVIDLAKKASDAVDGTPARPLELPPGYAKQWRPPFVK